MHKCYIWNYTALNDIKDKDENLIVHFTYYRSIVYSRQPMSLFVIVLYE